MNPSSCVVSNANWESMTSTMGDFLLDLLDDKVLADSAEGVYGTDGVSPGLYESMWVGDGGVHCSTWSSSDKLGM